MSRIEKGDQEVWEALSSKCYADQAKWMLNGFWDTIGPEAESVWMWCASFGELDPDKRAEGCDLDEFWSHKFLEGLGETMTVIEMREKFRKIDADFNKRMSLVEFLMYRYGLVAHQVISAPQGDNKEGIAKAQEMVDAAQAAVDDMTAKLAAAQSAASEAAQKASAAQSAAASARSAEEEAKKSAQAAQKAESAAKEAASAAAATAQEAARTAEAAQQAAAENRKALEELHAQEKEYEDKKAALTQTKEDQSLGVVRRNKAANELDQLLSEDPLPLRKAKIQQGATVKKSEKAEAAAKEAKAKADADAAAAESAAQEAARTREDADAAAAAAESARQAAEEAAAEAETARQAAEQAKQEAEASVSEAEARFQEALDFLEEEKHKGGIAQGDIWWMEREITEKKKYLPASRQK